MLEIKLVYVFEVDFDWFCWSPFTGDFATNCVVIHQYGEIKVAYLPLTSMVFLLNVYLRGHNFTISYS